MLFTISLATILLLSKKNLWGAIILGGTILSLLSPKPLNTLTLALLKLCKLDILLLAIALAEIPLIGKLLEEHLRRVFLSTGRSTASILGPAIFGLLPIPGGAILSCPVIERTIRELKSREEKLLSTSGFDTYYFLYILYPPHLL